MFFATDDQCKEWISGRGKELPEKTGWDSLTVDYPERPGGLLKLIRIISDTQIPSDSDVLLWLTEWGVWESSENLHLYYRLRQSYGNFEPHWDSPGHIFLKHELYDFQSYLQISMMNGWGGYIFAYGSNMAVHFSHDSYVTFYAEQMADLLELRSSLDAAEISVSSNK